MKNAKYNVLAFAPGVFRNKWIHPTNLACNGSGGYYPEPMNDVKGGEYVAIRWLKRK